MNKTSFAVFGASGCGRGVMPLARQQLQGLVVPICARQLGDGKHGMDNATLAHHPDHACKSMV